MEKGTAQSLRLFNLLEEPIFRVQTREGRRRLSLPEVFEALGRDEIEHFLGLQKHQEDPFHVFLSYLGAAVLARNGEEDPVRPADYWRDKLRALAGPAGDDAWTLVVEEMLQPAFMQPPLPRADHARLKPTAYTPDELDLLPTAKNHDLKKARASSAEVDGWVYALISLQTMSGYYGRGNRGISRMNSGYGNRPIAEVVRSFRPGRRWKDAVERLLLHRREVLRRPFGYDPHQGLVLVWTEIWDGKTSLPLRRLDPFYLEICRRIRLRSDGTSIVQADSLPADNDRIAAKDLKGVVGDAWLPVVMPKDAKDEPKAYTVPPEGISVDTLRRLIFEEGFELGALQKPLDRWQGDVYFSISVLVRGEGKTNGFYHQIVTIPERAHPRLWKRQEQRETFAKLSKNAVERAGEVEHRILKPAVYALLGNLERGGRENVTFKTWWERAAREYTAAWEDAFFPWLWSVPEDVSRDEALQEWTRKLYSIALEVLRETERRLPSKEGRRYQTVAAAERIFLGAFYNRFSELSQQRKEEVHP
ncbi:type I-E CRISPR-associated protein Cse1/CasA [Hydrogenibacillus sp. N12]|uniref:type I-E CRISPR-associated protein Cse1/CasA n=1 Tax=Hydrogenibacillus sp. N12 TaxID=2866627 RepID=UPI001C7D933A|nr:type I-E CRISPR-associated protein Cse1/CasA [Hydrogenibacillus sp. N12]QZA33236.1 type I-E CRISPR-associated protein Cse1/CasA [Hydrogenibacillus sp. N12]